MKTITFTDKQKRILKMLYLMENESTYIKNLIHKIIEQGFYKDSQRELLNIMRQKHMDYLKSNISISAIQFSKR